MVEEVGRLNIERREQIKQYILDKGHVQITQLETQFPDVSVMTLRRDIAYLEEQGEIIRIKGGARSVKSLSPSGEDLFGLRMSENNDAKMIIAKKAVDYAETRRSIFIDSGTTMFWLAKVLPDQNLYVITSGPNIALEIIKKGNPLVTLIGGQLSRNNLSDSGILALEFVNRINIDIAFLATSAFSLRSGFTVGNQDECELKKLVIRKAEKKIMLMDSSKIDKNMPFTFANLQDIDILISNEELPDEIKQEAAKNQVIVL
jgi:DeoR family transcriptional regulator, fructose operon transcriptional repressor